MQMLCQFKEESDEWAMIGLEHSGNTIQNQKIKAEPTEEEV